MLVKEIFQIHEVVSDMVGIGAQLDLQAGRPELQLRCGSQEIEPRTDSLVSRL